MFISAEYLESRILLHGWRSATWFSTMWQHWVSKKSRCFFS